MYSLGDSYGIFVLYIPAVDSLNIGITIFTLYVFCMYLMKLSTPLSKSNQMFAMSKSGI